MLKDAVFSIQQQAAENFSDKIREQRQRDTNVTNGPLRPTLALAVVIKIVVLFQDQRRSDLYDVWGQGIVTFAFDARYPKGTNRSLRKSRYAVSGVHQVLSKAHVAYALGAC